MIRIGTGAVLALLIALPAPALADALDGRALQRLAAHAADIAKKAGQAPDPAAAQAAAQAVSDALDQNPQAAGREDALKALNKGHVADAIQSLTGQLDALAKKKAHAEAAQAARILLALARLTGDGPLERRAAEANARHDPKDPASQGLLSAVLVAQGDLVAAETAWRKVINSTPGQPEARRAALAALISLLDERAKALKAEHARGGIARPYELAERMNALGELYGAISEKIAAAGMHHRALQVLETTGDTQAVARQWELLGRFYEVFDEPFRAYAAYQKAISLFDQVGDTQRAARIRNWIQQKRLLP